MEAANRMFPRFAEKWGRLMGDRHVSMKGVSFFFIESMGTIPARACADGNDPGEQVTMWGKASQEKYESHLHCVPAFPQLLVYRICSDQLCSQVEPHTQSQHKSLFYTALP